MKFFLLVLLTTGGIVAATFMVPGLKEKIPRIPLPTSISLPKTHLLDALTKALPKKTEESPDKKESSPSGSVRGMQTSQVTQNLQQAGNAIGKVASEILTTSSASGAPIEVNSVVGQISKQVENIPSQVLQQAKVEYCKQVLIQDGYSLNR